MLKPNTQALSFEIAPTASQNFFVERKTRIIFLRGVFALYTFTFLPCLLGLLALTLQSGFSDLFVTFPFITWVSGGVSMLIGFSLSYSKILSRKIPINVLLFIIFSISFALFTSGLTFVIKESTVLIALIYLITNGLAIFVYSLTVKEYFKFRDAAFVVLMFLLLPLFVFGFYLRTELVSVTTLFIAAITISILILYFSQIMCKNRNFTMLPTDYIMGCMKLICVIPLLSEMADDEPLMKTSSIEEV